MYKKLMKAIKNIDNTLEHTLLARIPDLINFVY